MKIVKGIGIALAIVVVVLGAAYLLRSDPIGPIAGKQLSGTETHYPSSWEVCNNHDTVAVETNPGTPYSVTTWCIVVDGELYIPSGDGATRTWTQNVSLNPNVRIKMGGSIYPAKLVRVTDLPIEAAVEAILDKYPEAAEMMESSSTEDAWMFRAGPRDWP